MSRIECFGSVLVTWDDTVSSLGQSEPVPVTVRSHIAQLCRHRGSSCYGTRSGRGARSCRGTRFLLS